MNKAMIRDAMVSARAVLITAHNESSLAQLLDPHRKPVIERRIDGLTAAIDELDRDDTAIREAARRG